MQRSGRASLTRSTCYRQILAQVIEGWIQRNVVACDKQTEIKNISGFGSITMKKVDRSERPDEREMFERAVKLVKTDRTRTWRLDQAARSIFLTEFVSAFFLA